ncbi:MAG: hypothetical protein JWL65_5023 [Gammaproteobacteria bacterium]|jgi:hypothetical protein|nr:hypothetical protein [Gammaproteobacteria bacterium]
MRSFLAACVAVALIAGIAALVLDEGVQKSAAQAFSTSAVRL